MSINPNQNFPVFFTTIQEGNLSKTLWEKKKTLVISICFSPYILRRQYHLVWEENKLIVSDKSKSLSLTSSVCIISCHYTLTLSIQQNFRLVQIESICIRQNKCNLNTEILFGISRKHCRKKEKMLVISIFSFFHNVLKRFLFQGR